MKRNSFRSATFAVALSLFATSAHAWPLGRLFHAHPETASAKDHRIHFALYNRSGIIQDVTIGNRKYSLMPNAGISLWAPEGTQVISETTGLGHKKGDLLFAVASTLQNDTVSIR